MRQGNRQGFWKRSTFRKKKKGRQLTLDKTVGSRVWWHTQGLSEWKVSVRSKVVIVFKKSRYRLGHRLVVTPRRRRTAQGTVQAPRKSHGNCSLWSERGRPWSLSLKRCLREADGPTKDPRGKKQKKRPWVERCFVSPGRASRWCADEEPEEHKRLKNHFKDQSFHLVSLVEYHPISTKDQSRIHQVGKKALPREYSSDYVLYTWREFGKETLLVVDLEELQQMDASETMLNRLNAKEVNNA